MTGLLRVKNKKDLSLREHDIRMDAKVLIRLFT
jgi:hypothetical protein